LAAKNRFKTNPFTEGMVVPVKGKQVQISRFGKDDNILVNQHTGEEHGTHVITYKKTDSQQFVKLFTASMGFAFDLTSAGIKTFAVLLWAMQRGSLGKDQVDLESYVLEEFLEAQDDKKLKLSVQTFRRGLNELEKAKVLAKTMKPGRYFINPGYVFNGDRVAFTTVLEREKSHNENQNELQLN